MRRLARFACTMAILSTLTCSTVTAHAASKSANKPLNVYFVDVEGGQSTLFVTPSGESLLVDTGWPTGSTQRIVSLAHQAGVKKIDYVLITHYHADHVGGVPELVKAIPVGTFIDHGENRETQDEGVVKLARVYHDQLQKGQQKHLVVKPGDTLPLRDLKATVVSADGDVLKTPLPGAGAANPACKTTEQRPADDTENGRSAGVVLQFGKLRFLDLGDLTWDREMALMCPENKVGKIDVYIVSHHGWFHSGSPALVEGISPRVAIMDNGAKKGGSPAPWDVIHKTSSVEDLWQLHYSEEGAAAHNSPAPQIANLSGPDAGNYLRLTAWPDGHFEIFNSRTKQTKQYAAR